LKKVGGQHRREEERDEEEVQEVEVDKGIIYIASRRAQPGAAVMLEGLLKVCVGRGSVGIGGQSDSLSLARVRGRRAGPGFQARPKMA
jgi:hypothetical protein